LPCKTTLSLGPITWRASFTAGKEQTWKRLVFLSLSNHPFTSHNSADSQIREREAGRPELWQPDERKVGRKDEWRDLFEDEGLKKLSNKVSGVMDN